MLHTMNVMGICLQRVVPRPAAATKSGTVLGMQVLGLHLRTAPEGFNQPSR